MKLDIGVLSGIISVIVSILTFVFLHFVIEPIKQKKQFKEDQLKNLYAPLYSMIMTMSKLGSEYRRDHIIHMYMEGDVMLNKKHRDELILANMGYASREFIDIWTSYCKVLGEEKIPILHEFSKLVIKEYNQLRKDLGYPFDDEELETGVPTHYKHLRTYIKEGY